jgi:hypothetical protein
MSNRVGTAEFASYIANVIMPILRGSTDDGASAVFLTRQLDEWELEAERPDADPKANQVVAKLGDLLDEARERIKAKIAALQQILGTIESAPITLAA